MKKFVNNSVITSILTIICLIGSIAILDYFITDSLKNITLSMVQPQIKAVLVHTKTIFEKHEKTLDEITLEFEKMQIEKLSNIERDIVCADTTRRLLKNKNVKVLLNELYNYKVVSEMECIYVLTKINKKYYFVITDDMIEIRGFSTGKPLLLKDYTLLNSAFEKGSFHAGVVENKNEEHYSALWLIRKGYLLGADYNLNQGLYLIIDQIKYYGVLLLIICACIVRYIKIK